MKVRTLGTLILAVIALSLTTAGFAQIQRVIIKVDGLACPFCAYGLNKNLKKLPGVQQVKIHVDQGEAVLTFKPDVEVPLEALPEVVKRSGYTARTIVVEAKGTVQLVDSNLAFSARSNNSFVLAGPKDLLQRLREKLKTSKTPVTLKVTGVLQFQSPQGHHGHPPQLVVSSFE